jgi:outer membrane protein insertion porin family
VYYSFGPGFRFSLPQFPLRMMLANTFQVLDGKVAWQNGKGPEWQFVLSFNITNR